MTVSKVQSTHRTHSIDALWNGNSDKYKVCCSKFHVTKVARCIGLVQLMLLIISVAVWTLLILSGKQINDVEEDTLIEQNRPLYFTVLIAMIAFNLGVILMLLHGVKCERRSFLLPFLLCSAFAVFVSFIQVCVHFDVMVMNFNEATSCILFLSHVVAIFIHTWSVYVVWRCYCYLEDKKLAEQIREQLQTSSLASARDYSQPAPYMDTAEESPLITV